MKLLFASAIAGIAMIHADSVSEIVDDALQQADDIVDEIVGGGSVIPEISAEIDELSTISTPSSASTGSPKKMTDAIRKSYIPDLPKWVEKECCVCHDWSPSTPSTPSKPSTPSEGSDSVSIPSSTESIAEAAKDLVSEITAESVSTPTKPSEPSWSTPSKCCECNAKNTQPFTRADYLLGGSDKQSMTIGCLVGAGIIAALN